jgi:ClpP class serine protease
VSAEIRQLKWDRLGPTAIRAASYGLVFDVKAPEAVAAVDGVACVEICGPLTQHSTSFFDSYDAIKCRVQAALATDARQVVLKITSPGGDVWGNLECARAIRAMAEAAGKSLVTYVDGGAFSAAYALACAGDRIYIPQTGQVGSIGVVDTIASVARQDKAMGIDVAVITSGARKADGNPHLPISEGAVAAHQAHVDELAGILWAWVAERRGISVEQIKGYEAAEFTGASAVKAALADEILDFHELRVHLARGTNTAVATSVPSAKETMSTLKSSKYTEAIAALAALAEEGDEDAKKAIKKMMAPKKDDEKDAPAKSDAPPPEEKKVEVAQAVAASAAVQAVAAPASGEIELRARMIELENKLAAKEQAEERGRLLASRPDVMKDENLSAWLKTAPIETVREAVAKLPVLAPALPKVAQATQGAGQGGVSGGLPADASEALKIRMGLTPHPVATTARVGFKTVFGATPEQVKEIEAGTIRFDKDGK